MKNHPNPPNHPKSHPQTSPQPPFADEARHLAKITALLQQALQNAAQTLAKQNAEYTGAKRYMAQNRGELDPHEMFQNELSLRQIDESAAFAATTQQKLSKLCASPYFARIDFQAQGEAAPAAYYIGRFSFTAQGEPQIYDWRAPLAGLFYSAGLGAASYTAPSGEIAGKLTRKRQFKITNGQLEYTLESAAHIQDEVLQRELSLTSDERMKSIIATIQREQDEIIRGQPSQTLLIQGVAGSGKTSIALHRVAFLLYNFPNRLTAQNVAILSPSRVFGSYISGVLPELGEEPIAELGLADIAKAQLPRPLCFIPQHSPAEPQDRLAAERARLKTGEPFTQQLNRYIAQMQHTIFAAQNYSWGPFSLPASWLQARFAAYGAQPVKQRLRQLAQDIRERLGDENHFDESLPTLSGIVKSLNTMLLYKSTLALYQNFYRFIGRPKALALPHKNTLEWEDVFPFLYLHAAFEGLKPDGATRHLLVDEMQDYSPLQFAVLNLLYPCPKTILGDFSQMLNPNHTHGLGQLRALYPNARFVELNTSYRSTAEIITFAKAIQPAAPLQPIHRHGPPVAICPCKNPQDEMALLLEAVQNFAQSGYASLGILCQTDAQAQACCRALPGAGRVHHLTAASTHFAGGITVATVPLAKGLEFDAVLLPGVSAQHYHTAQHRALLYVACTRALHSLSLFYSGPPSPFLPKNRGPAS